MSRGSLPNYQISILNISASPVLDKVTISASFRLIDSPTPLVDATDSGIYV